MKPAVAVLLLVSSVLMAAHSPGRFEDGYTFTAIQTSILAGPYHPEELIVTLPPGHRVEIEGVSEVVFTANSFQWGWYWVSCVLGGISYSGYVFEGELALAHLSPGADTLIVYRTLGPSLEDNTVNGEVSVISNGETRSTLNVQPRWLQNQTSFNVNVCFLDPSGLTGVRHLISLYSGKWITPGSEREYLIVWTDQGQLVSGPQTMGMAPGGPTRYYTKIILPSDTGGEDDVVVLNILGEVYNTDTDTWDLIINEPQSYLWTGVEFEIMGEVE